MFGYKDSIQLGFNIHVLLRTFKEYYRSLFIILTKISSKKYITVVPSKKKKVYYSTPFNKKTKKELFINYEKFNEKTKIMVKLEIT